MKGVLPWLVHWACRAGTRDFCSVFSSRPRTKYFFLAVRYFHYFFPIAQQAGQAAMLGRLSLSVCLWFCSPLIPALLTLQTTLISRYTLKLWKIPALNNLKWVLGSVLCKIFLFSILYFPYQLLIIQNTE
jgi:hypothetical protein